MCVGNYTHIFFGAIKIMSTKHESISLSQANQLIHVQRDKIRQLENTIALLEHQVAEETRMRYAAWKRLAETVKT